LKWDGYITTTKDTQAAITIVINSGSDNFLLENEITPIFISGTVTNVEAFQTVTVVLSNENGDTETITATVGGDLTWSTSTDLSTFTDGALTATATVNDVAGNITTNQDIAIIDTQSTIAMAIGTWDDTVDFVINAAEASLVEISGIVGAVDNGEVITVRATDGSDTLTFTTLVSGVTWSVGTVNLSSLTDGDITFTADVMDAAGNPANATKVKTLDTQAEITISVDTNEDTTDNTINSIESTQVNISGSVTKIEDGQTVTLKVTDGSTTLSFTSVVNSSVWQVNDADISSLLDGTITYSVDVIDVAGNPATKSTTTEKNTQAAITIEVDTNGDVTDEVINNEESTLFVISGTTTNVEDNSSVTISVSDAFNTLTFTATVTSDTWQINNADISTLVDGDITYIAEVTDLVGNPANASTTVLKDTTASITIVTNDALINDIEITSTDISGTVANIEDNQTVNLAVTDGVTTIDFSTTVISGVWQVTGMNLSSLEDGLITYTVGSSDVAGNPASNSTTSIKDSEALVTIIVDTNADTSDNIINAAESTHVKISGSVTNIENDQPATLTVTDGVTTLSFTTTVISGDWQVENADLSSLIDGTLTYTVDVSDVAGNPATATTTTLKDTQAAISILVDTSFDTTDSVINALESTQVDISGTVTNIENNQDITLYVTDGATTLSFDTTVIAGNWQVDNADLSGLTDGSLTYTAEVADVAGNPATIATTAIKDSLATITIVVDTNANTADNVINDVEQAQVDISGTVTNINDNQAITLNVTDGSNTLSFSSTVIAGVWQVDDADLSSLTDGTLTYSVDIYPSHFKMQGKTFESCH